MKPRPKTGEKRDVRQPLKIDKLPPNIQDRIRAERMKGRTWLEIEAASPGWKQWADADEATKALFPGLRLPHSNLQRWYDLRIEQVSREMAVESERARLFAEAIAKGGLDHLEPAILNALHDQVFSVMRASTPKQYQAALTEMGYLLAKFKDAAAKKVRADAEAKAVALKERELNEKKKQADKATNDAAKKLGKGKAVTLDDINRIRERVFGLPPVQAAAGNPA